MCYILLKKKKWTCKSIDDSYVQWRSNNNCFVFLQLLKIVNYPTDRKDLQNVNEYELIY